MTGLRRWFLTYLLNKHLASIYAESTFSLLPSLALLKLPGMLTTGSSNWHYFSESVSDFCPQVMKTQNTNSFSPSSPFFLHLSSLPLNPLSLSSLFVQSLCRVRLFVTPWIAAHQTSLFFPISRSFFISLHTHIINIFNMSFNTLL